MTDETWKDTLARAEAMTLDQARNQLSDSVYQATKLVEALESVGKIVGNGHHIRRTLAKASSDLLAERWREDTPQ